MTDLKLSKKEILSDYALACESREISLIGRKEVLTGKAKFGIFGDGKELPQLAMARVFKHGDFRSGYYRDQSFMMAIGELSSRAFFAQLYAHTDINEEPASAGRSMNGHFATRSLDENGNWKDLKKQFNSSADISPTGSQMPRLLGLAYASKLYRQNKALHKENKFSNKGNEVAFGTIGNASTSEGMFFESINAAGVLQVPMLISVWDDDYGISVPSRYQTTKQNISEVLSGFQREKGKNNGFEIISVNGWDYPTLIKVYRRAEKIAREEHCPVLVHVRELTQPQGHSTSGSHERYKSKERLQWEKDFDCIKKMREWILSETIASEDEVSKIEKEALLKAKNARKEAWESYRKSIDISKNEALRLLDKLSQESSSTELVSLIQNLKIAKTSFLKDTIKAAKQALFLSRNEMLESQEDVRHFLNSEKEQNYDRYNSHLYSQSSDSIANLQITPIRYKADAEAVDARLILQACFDAWFKKDQRIFAIGEDLGKIGDVNQAFAGLQEKYGEIRITDTGIREVTIMGQGIGAALRGLRPICEIQYLDYILYATQILSDDLASLQYRSKGGQKAPMIIRTRGHRLEGIWHAGSPMAHIINAFHGIHVLVPRNMTQAAGFYNSILSSDEPALIVECLNGYRLKEKMPENVGEFTIPLGVPERLKEGKDITVVSYGSTLRVIEDALPKLEACDISVELIDVQSLLPFDSNHLIVESIKRTNRVLFIDEDMPGGATAYMMQKVIDEQNAWDYLDSKPQCLSARENRPAYASDGDYFCKPNAEDVFEAVYAMMNEVNPEKYPNFL